MRYIFISGILLFALCLPLFGQTAGEIAGIVMDPTGGVVPAASVTVTNEETSATRTTTTTAAGIYTFPSLVPR